MKYFKDTQGNIYAVSPIQTPKKEWVALTKKETEAHLNPQPTTEQILAEQIAEAQTYLDRTDHKFYGDYEVKPDEDLEPIRINRSTARALIRDNEVKT